MGYIVFQHNDDDDLVNGKSYLSLYSFPQLSLIQSHILPIYVKDRIVGSHCNGIYFFSDLLHNSVILNLTTKEFKPLTLPQLEPPPSLAILEACGIGRDPNSGVYKILVAYPQHFSRIDIDGELVDDYDYKNRALLYSFDTDSWAWIDCPFGFSAGSDSVYIGHKRYWTALIMKKPVDHHVSSSVRKFELLSFNFRTKRFAAFPLPRYPPGAPITTYLYHLVEYGEMLGAIGYSCDDASMDYEIWVREGKSWRIVHSISFGRFERPLALKDEQFLFCAGPCSDDDELCVDHEERMQQRSEVAMVDVVGGGLPRTFKIYGQQHKLGVLPFDENPYPLLGGQPLINSYSDGEDEKIGKKLKKKKKKSSKKKNSKKH